MNPEISIPSALYRINMHHCINPLFLGIGNFFAKNPKNIHEETYFSTPIHDFLLKGQNSFAKKN